MNFLFLFLFFQGEWPQFLGPERNGVVHELAFPQEPQLSVAWSRDLGSGYSGIVVRGNHLYTMHKQGDFDVLSCLNTSSGETVWQYQIAPFFPKVGSSHDGPLSTPVMDKDKIYALGPRGQFFALRLKDGSLVWKVHVKDQLGGIQPELGFITSPIIVKDRIVLQIGEPKSKAIAAFDRNTGAMVWSSATGIVKVQGPSLVTFNGKSYLIALTEDGIFGLAPESGDVLWFYQLKNGSQVLATGENRFLIDENMNYTHYEWQMNQGKVELKQLWRNEILQFGYDFPTIYQGHAYGSKYGAGVISCLNLETGKRAWQARIPASGTTTLVNDFLVIWGGGELRLAKASPQAYEEVAQVKVFDTKERYSFTLPAYANRHFYVRNLSKIAAVGVK